MPTGPVSSVSHDPAAQCSAVYPESAALGSAPASRSRRASATCPRTVAVTSGVAAVSAA